MRRAKNFFKTPKGLLTIILIGLAAIAAPHEGLRDVLPGLLSAVVLAGLVDTVILWIKKKVWEFPSGAVLTAMIVSMVLRAQEPWYVVSITSVAAILSKYIFRSRHANVFNPAALAVIASFYVFHTGQSWWGALTEVPLWQQAVLLVAGIFITDRVNKIPLVLVFLGTYFSLFTIMAYFGDPHWVSEIYRSPDLEAALFFAFIILTDPPTSPAKYPDQIVCGVLVAAVSFAFFEWAGVVYYLLAGVLVGNVWEAWRRVHRRSTAPFPRGIGTFLREISPWKVRHPGRAVHSVAR
jgi:Na+-translocating ferredoxin:NAD+ oxidoreductase RnfD subunit